MLNIFKKKNESQQIRCQYCGMKFADKNRFLKHREKAHPKGR
ncbi:MAG: hypothetical protein QXU32_13080 [Nitrososphaerales archaeon]